MEQYKFVMDARRAKMAAATLLVTRDTFRVVPALDGQHYEVTTDANPYLLRLEWFAASLQMETKEGITR